VPSCKPIRMEGRIVRHEGRKHFVEATIFDADSTALAHGKGVFIEVRPPKPS
jgi:acyl-coenzyme A thioesterase PaaI-like protein